MIKTNEVMNDIIHFLLLNGWNKDIGFDYEKEDFLHYSNLYNYSIDINDSEVVFIDESGDFKHIDIINKDTIYTVIGYMIEISALSVSYYRWKNMYKG